MSEDESFEVLLDIALTYMDANRKDNSYQWLEKIRQKGINEKNNQKFRDAWCDYCMTFGEPEKATEAFQLSLDELPYSVAHWNGLAKCYLAQDEIEKALEAVDFSLAIEENNYDALEVKAYCFLQSENQEEAIAIYQQLLPRAKVPSRIYAPMVKSYMMLEKADEAKATCLEWLKKCPKLTSFEKSEIFSYISMCSFNLGQTLEGMEYIDAALNLEPSFRGAMLQKGMLHLQLKEYDEAEDLFYKVMDISPDDELSEVIYNIANSYYFLELYPETIAWCEKIILNYPDEQMEALHLIACSHYNMSDVHQCLRYLTQIWQMNNSNFDEAYLNDKRFKHMFENIAQANKNYKNKKTNE